jgi:hypothetical protein
MYLAFWTSFDALLNFLNQEKLLSLNITQLTIAQLNHTYLVEPPSFSCKGTIDQFNHRSVEPLLGKHDLVE